MRRDPDYGHPVMLLIINGLRFSRISILPTLLWTPGNAEIPASAGRTGRHKLEWCKLGHYQLNLWRSGLNGGNRAQNMDGMRRM